MNIKKVCALALGLTLFASVQANVSLLVTDPEASSKVYVDSQTPAADVDKALLEAKSKNLNLIVVMGAQWCHDSRGLAAQFASDAMIPVLKQYKVTYVDVGYFKDLRNISRRFGLAHYFATPTVMIINPQTEALLNASDMHIWGSADSIPTEEYVAYFTKYINKSESSLPEVSPAQNNVIQAFKSAQADRLTRAYEKLVPGLKTDDNTPEFIDQWRQVRKFRSQLQTDIFDLYQQASLHPDTELQLPVYPAFTWESL